jgi:hypothetical protein
MTKPPPAVGEFKNWHYRRKPTHIGFYSRATFEYITAHWPATRVFGGMDVVLLRKP